MIKINALIFLFIIQGMLVFLGITFFMVAKYKKQAKKEAAYKEEIEKLRENTGNADRKNEDHVKYKEMFNNLKKDFERIRATNTELQETVATLVPEAERSDEYKKMIAQFESNNKELDNCLGTLENENEALDNKIGNIKEEVSGLNRKLKNSVSKSEFEMLEVEKNRLDNKVKSLKDEVESKTEEYAKLDKNYLWLEKEYNALYESTEQDKNAS